MNTTIEESINTLVRKDRVLGMGVAAAIGDALGAAVEFCPRDSFEPVTGYRGDGPHPIQAGEWTDDTSMSLALADAYLSDKPCSLQHLENYRLWFREGKYSVNGRCFDIGMQTAAAIRDYERYGERLYEERAVDENACGNGSLMRMAPVVARWHDADFAWLAHQAQVMGRTTHPARRCQEACVALAATLSLLLEGERPERLLKGRKIERLARPADPEILAVVRGSYLGKRRAGIQSTGYVVHTLEAALWSLWIGDDFETTVLSAVNLGGDADTIGSVAGMLAGAAYGLSGSPQDLREGLSQGAMIEGVYQALWEKGCE